MKLFVVNDIDIHQLDLGPSRILIFLVENSLKDFFFHFFSNKSKIINVFKERKKTK